MMHFRLDQTSHARRKPGVDFVHSDCLRLYYSSSFLWAGEEVLLAVSVVWRHFARAVEAMVYWMVTKIPPFPMPSVSEVAVCPVLGDAQPGSLSQQQANRCRMIVQLWA